MVFVSVTGFSGGEQPVSWREIFVNELRTVFRGRRPVPVGKKDGRIEEASQTGR